MVDFVEVYEDLEKDQTLVGTGSASPSRDSRDSRDSREQFQIMVKWGVRHAFTQRPGSDPG